MNRALVIVSKTLNKNTLKYYSEILPKESIYFVSPNKDNYLEKYKNIVYKEDDFFLKREDYPVIERTNRPNWYFQQFLKYQIVLSLDYDLIHIVDGDSYVKKDVIFNENIFYSKKKIETNYYDFVNLLFKKEKNHSTRNFITNQMCFNKKYIIQLVSQINDSDNNWIDVICNILIGNTNLWFSEYQTYADFILSNKNVEEKSCKVFRRIDLIEDTLYRSFRKYDVLAEEPQHNTDFLRRIRAKLLYLFNLNLG